MKIVVATVGDLCVVGNTCACYADNGPKDVKHIKQYFSLKAGSEPLGGPSQKSAFLDVCHVVMLHIKLKGLKSLTICKHLTLHTPLG